MTWGVDFLSGNLLKSLFDSLNIVCVDVNLRQLKFGVSLQDDLKEEDNIPIIKRQYQRV